MGKCILAEIELGGGYLVAVMGSSSVTCSTQSSIARKQLKNTVAEMKLLQGFWSRVWGEVLRV